MARGLERPPWWAIVVVVVGLVALVVGVTVSANRGGEPLSKAELNRLDAAASSAEASAAAADAAAHPTLTLPPAGSPVLFFGDSYTQGYGAKPEKSNGYAPLVASAHGWDATIDAVSGTGYLDAGPHSEGTYIDRLAALPDVQPALVVLQGGLNDQDMKPTVETEKAAAAQVIAGIRSRYPSAALVVLGPVCPVDVPSRELVLVDHGLRAAATDAGVPYISPLTQQWRITDHTIADKTHPDNDGYAYIAQSLEKAFSALAPAA